MIKIPGRLFVKTIHGRHGPFNVGRLATSIGEFVIKDPQLEQFSEGQFSGEFLVLEIRPASYFAGGRLVVEVRARVGEMLLSDNGVLVSQSDKPHFDSSEIDPLEEEATPQTQTPPVQSQPQPMQQRQFQPVRAKETPQAASPAATPQNVPPVQNESDNPDMKLFGLLWPLGNTVKLDPTIERAVFRSQVSRLKEMGYQFQSKTQTWFK
ncbi:DUF3275 family protein [Halomonas colorata]|uniref:DUF3275 family protein n=1 Tax=Halomonas colorata TaxID=2742615 RepID=UPI001865B71C|nr:DUF3275 family protein [Halomonas colorata]